MKRIAIIGGGIAGLSLCFFLLEQGVGKVELFEAGAESASVISTGLLHPFPGRRASYSWKAKEALCVAETLVEVAERALGRSVAQRSGVFRPAIAAHQRSDFQRRAREYPEEAIWCEKPPFGEGLWIPRGITLFSMLFLEGIRKVCRERGALFSRKVFSSLGELAGFDQVVLAAGAGTLAFAEARSLPLKATKGQALLCRAQEPLPFSLVSLGHIAATEDPQLYQVGSTYEREFSGGGPHWETALPLLDQAALFYPAVRSWEVVGVRAAVRAVHIGDYRPLVQQLSPASSPASWVFSGLGSRGMLYAPWFGKRLAEAIASGSE